MGLGLIGRSGKDGWCARAFIHQKAGEWWQIVCVFIFFIPSGLKLLTLCEQKETWLNYCRLLDVSSNGNAIFSVLIAPFIPV